MTGGTTRHTVRLSGGCPWGFRLQGGAKTGQSLSVAKIRRKSKAHEKLCEGDKIISINGQSCERLTHDQAMHIVEMATSELLLEIIRPESNKENVIPSSTPFGAPHSATSFTVSSGGQTTKVTEESHYQQIKSSVIRSESPIDPPKVLKHETTKTELRTSSGDKLIPLCVEAFQDSVLSPISGFSKTKKQEVTESSSSYEQFQSNTVRSGSETKSTAEKLVPKCIEAFQDSVLSPISGIKKTKNQEVIENSHYQDNSLSDKESVTSPVSSDSPRIWMSVTETRSPVLQHSPQQNQSNVVRPMSLPTYCNSPKPWSPSPQPASAVHSVLPICVEAFQDSVLSPISGIPKTKKQEIVEQSTYRHSQTTSASSVASLVRCISPKPWSSPDTEVETNRPLDGNIPQHSPISPLAGVSKIRSQESQSSMIRSVTPPGSSGSISQIPNTQIRSSPVEKILPLCSQESVISSVNEAANARQQEVTEYSHYQDNVNQPPMTSPPDSPRIWVCVKEVRTSSTRTVPQQCVKTSQEYVRPTVNEVQKTKQQEALEQSEFKETRERVKRFWHERTSSINGSETRSSAAKNLLPLCIEAFQDSVLSPVSGIRKSTNQESQPVASPMPFASSKPGKPESQAQKLLPVCVEAFQDSVLSPISGIKKTKTQEVHSSMVHSVQTSSSAPSKPWNLVESQGKCSTAENLLPVCVEAFQDCVLSPITGISRTKKQEIQSSMTRSATPPVPNTVPKPWKSPTETESYQAAAAAAKLLPMCLEAFQDSVLSPISGISKTMKAEIRSSPIRSVTPPKPWKPDTQAKSSAEKVLPLCVEAFQDSVLSPISGVSRTKVQEVAATPVTEPKVTPSVGEKLLPVCVEAFQDSVLSPISSISKTKPNEPIEPASAQPTPSAGEKLLPLCLEAFQDSVLSPISGICKTKNKEEVSSEETEPQNQPTGAEKLLPFCVEAFQDSVLSPISGISKTKEVNEPPAPEPEVQQSSSNAEKLLPLCLEAFQDSVLSPISGISKTKNKEVAAPVPAAESQTEPSRGEALLPMCVEAFQDSVLSPISGIRKTKDKEEVEPTSSLSEEKPGERFLPLCVEAFQDSVLSPISGIKKTMNKEITDQSRETMSSMTRSQTPPFSQQSQVMAGAQKLLPTCVEAFRDSVLSPISGVSKTKTHEVTKDGNKTEKTTTETIQETKGSCQTTILRKEKESIVRDSFATGNRPIFQATPLSAVMSQPSTFATGNRPIFQATPLSAAMSQPSTVKMTKSETKSTETRHNVWKPTGEVAGKIKGFSYTQDAAVRNKPVAPATQSVMSSDVYNRSEMDNSTMTRKNEYNNGMPSGAFSPEPPMLPSRTFVQSPMNKPTFQNFNITPKTWNEAKKTEQPAGFKPVRPPTYYAK